MYYEKRPLGKPKYRLKNNILDLKEINEVQRIGLIYFRIGIISEPS
jgi:hypothetical protein